MASIISFLGQVLKVAWQTITHNDSSSENPDQIQWSDTKTLDTNSAHYYIGYRTGDLRTPWAKYFRPVDTALTATFIDGCLKSPVASELGIPLTKAPKLLEAPGYLPLENGWTKLEDGTLYICALSDLPDVTGDMLDFWFYWHTNCSSKYKLWHPDAHRYAWIDRRKKTTKEEVEKMSYKERYWNTTSYVNEYIGNASQNLSIGFFDPRLFNFALSTPDTESETGIQTVVTAFVEPGRYTQILPDWRAKQGPNSGAGKDSLRIVLMHQLRRKPDGSGKCEMRSRFWIGSLLVAGMKVIGTDPNQFAHDMATHCHVEMTHLGEILPGLYEEFKDDICW